MNRETMKHTFDTKAFFKNNAVTVLGAVFILAQVVIQVRTDDDAQGWLTVKSMMLMLPTAVYVILMVHMLYQGKRSEIYSLPECVVYRKRRCGFAAVADILAASFGGHERVMYDVYVISDVQNIDKQMTVKGDNTVAQVYEDKKTVHRQKAKWRVPIPRWYTDSARVRDVLEQMSRRPKTEASVQKGFLGRLED